MSYLDLVRSAKAWVKTTTAIRPLEMAFLVAASLLCLYGLGEPSLTGDEARFANAISGAKASPMLASRPPLYILLVRILVGVLGSAEWVYRLPAALAGVATLWVLHVVVRQIGGRIAGVLAVLFLLLSPVFFMHAHIGKPYTFDSLCASLLILAYLRYRSRSSPTVLWLYGIIAVFSMGFSLAFIFVLAAIFLLEILEALMARRWKSGFLLLNLGLSLGFFLFYLIFYADVSSSWLQGYWAPRLLSETTVVPAARWSLANATLLIHGLSPITSIVAAGLIVLAGTVSALRAGEQGRTLFLVGVATASLHLLAGAARRYPFGEPRLALDLAIFVAAFSALALAGLLRQRGPARLPTAISVAALLYLGCFPAIGMMKEYLYTGHAFRVEDTGPLIRRLNLDYRIGDGVWVAPGAAASFFYYGSHQIREEDLLLGRSYRTHPERHDSMVSASAGRYDRLWVLFTHDPLGELAGLRELLFMRYQSESIHRRWRDSWLELWVLRDEPISLQEAKQTIRDQPEGPLLFSRAK